MHIQGMQIQHHTAKIAMQAHRSYAVQALLQTVTAAQIILKCPLLWLSTTAQLQCHIASCGACYSNYSHHIPAAVTGLLPAAAVHFTSEYWQTMQATFADLQVALTVNHVTQPRKL